MNRDVIKNEVNRKFGLADLLPIESKMIDTVIDATLPVVADAIRDHAIRLASGREPDRAAALGDRLSSYAAGLLSAAVLVENMLHVEADSGGVA